MAYLLHQLLQESARRSPQGEAVKFLEESLSYDELDRLSNQLARTLQSQGVQQGDRVGILLHKSIASVAAVFGIMKAGGVYVPIDANSPEKRVTYIVQNCEIRILVTSPMCLEETTPWLSEIGAIETVIVLGHPSQSSQAAASLNKLSMEQVTSEDDAPVENVHTIESDLAYILYTSGSTGDPKGVMISHRTILTFINWAHEKFGLSETDRVTSHAPLHFDLSTFDIYATIKAGGTVVVVPEKLAVFPVQLVRLLQEEQITVTYLVPSVLSMMVNFGNLSGHDLSMLRLVLFAGEVFPIKYLRQLVAAVPKAEYYNLYGPTETNVCTYYKVSVEDLGEDRTDPVPIGVACENMEVFALDDAGEIVSDPGQEGELWARGPCVAQGYWGDQEKTANVFVLNPVQTDFIETACRTGDIVRLAPDARNWIYIGRRDHMIKSRGYRIELGEIEAALYGHDQVQEAAVVAVPDDIVGNRIRGYVVPRPGSELTPRLLSIHMHATVPDYMVPESIEILDELPMTSTGKVNRPQLADA